MFINVHADWFGVTIASPNWETQRSERLAFIKICKWDKWVGSICNCLPNGEIFNLFGIFFFFFCKLQSKWRSQKYSFEFVCIGSLTWRMAHILDCEISGNVRQQRQRVSCPWKCLHRMGFPFWKAILTVPRLLEKNYNFKIRSSAVHLNYLNKQGSSFLN